MKVSVVTTCYNRVNTVARAVKSVMNQDYPSIEHIIIDGGSTDGSVDAIKACNSPRIAKFISERDKGCYNALNKGLKLATGDIVCWLHSDDVFATDHVISDVVKAFEETGCDMIYADGLFVGPNDPNWVIRNWISGTYSDKKIENGWLPLHTTVFVSREVYEKSGGYDEDYRISSDSLWLIKVMYKTGIKIHYLKQHVVMMSYGGLSTSWSKTILRWREDLGVYVRSGISPRKALFQKVMRKIPQFLKGPFAKNKHSQGMELMNME